MEPRAEIARDVERLLGVGLRWSASGAPEISAEDLPRAKWPRALKPEETVVMDPSGDSATFCWPLPRFEILVANLDAIGFKVAGTGTTPDGETILRAQWDLSQERKLLKRAAVIRESRLWIGHDTIWRHVAAALGTPQVVLQGPRAIEGLIYADTHVAGSSGARAESKALGPLSVKEVSELILSALKHGPGWS